MTTTQIEPTDVQTTLHRVALSLESLLLNGIPYGVYQQDLFPGFLAQRAGELLRQLDALDDASQRTGRPATAETFASLRASALRLIALLTDLMAFRTLSGDRLRAAVARIGPLRDECVLQIQQLEALFQTREPFYQSRDPHLAACVEAFVANLQQAFAAELAAGTARKG